MVEYNCRRCGYSTTRYGNFMNHLKRTRACPSTLSTISNEQQIQDLLEASQNREGQYKCDYCDKPYQTRQGKYLHKRSCTVRREVPTDVRQDAVRSSSTSPVITMDTNNGSIMAADTINNNTNNTNNNTTNNTTNNNTTNNNNIVIQLRAFGDENLDYLLTGENPKLREILNTRKAFMQNLIKAIHFNEEHPENMNVYLTNLRSKHIMAYSGAMFEVRMKDSTLDSMVVSNTELVERNLDTIGVTEETKAAIRERLQRLNNADEKKCKIELKDKLEIMCYNNRNMVLKHSVEDEF